MKNHRYVSKSGRVLNLSTLKVRILSKTEGLRTPTVWRLEYQGEEYRLDVGWLKSLLYLSVDWALRVHDAAAGLLRRAYARLEYLYDYEIRRSDDSL